MVFLINFSRFLSGNFTILEDLFLSLELKAVLELISV